MGLDDNHNVAARYRTVRKHLDTLGYTQTLSLDALPLIETLLADLIQTTDSLKHFKSVAQEYIEKCSDLQVAVDPYKCDNAKLVQECNKLHLDLIEAKETCQKQTCDSRKQLKKLEIDYSELQLTSSRNIQRIKELEAESAKKSKKILELQGKCCKPVINNVALGPKKRSSYPLRRPSVEREQLPRAVSSTSSLPSNRNADPYVIDIVNMGDQRINCLNHEVTSLKSEISFQTDTINTLHSQLLHKEKEIMRLRKMLEGGRPYSAVTADCYCKNEKKRIEVNSPPDSQEARVLQQAKMNLEQQLKDALDKQHEAMTQAMRLAERNESLQKELKDIDHIALAVEADCSSAVKKKDKELSRLQEKFEAVTGQIQALENELITARREVQEMKADLETSRQEKRNIQRLLESALDDKKQMTDKINELTVMEQKLNSEIEKLTKEKQKETPMQRSKQTLPVQKPRPIVARNNKFRGRNNKETICQNKTVNAQIKRPMEKAQFQPLSASRNQGVHSKAFKSTDHTQEKILTLEAERDFYKNEYVNRNKEHFNKETEIESSTSASRIRDLKQQLLEKERAITEITREKKELGKEKANFETRLHNAPRRQCCPVCNPCNMQHAACSCTRSERDSNTMKTKLDRLERERDSAKADVERLMQERDALHKRLQIATEAHLNEQRRLKENLADVESRLKKAESERHELRISQGTRRVTIDGLEEECDDLKEELRKTKKELAEQRTQYYQLRALQDQTDQALGDIQSQLSQSESELSKAIDHNRGMEQEQMQLDNHAKELKQEINTLRASMAQLDREKDQLLMELDERTEKIASLERELHYKEQKSSNLEQQIRDLEVKNEICIDQRAEQDRQCRNMQIEMENLQRQLTSSSMDRNVAIQENRRLQEDLAAVTCEVRNLQRELESSRAESCDLKRQLQTYVSEVRRAEELLSRKEYERTEMLDHYKSLSLEATVLENSNHSLESEVAEARGALQATREQLLEIERQISNKDCLVRRYEAQISELTQNVARLEIQLRQQTEQRQRTEDDLNAVRNLSVQLDKQKDCLAKQLKEKESLQAQYEAQLDRLRTDHNVVQDQMCRNDAAVDQLENLLTRARTETMDAQKRNQELQNEVDRLKQKTTQLQCKLSAESTELREYQSQAVGYNRQISELRRQVIDEQFDRAKKDEQNRRSLNSTPDSFNVDLNVVI